MKTPLHTLHQETGAQFTALGGWQIPMHYGVSVEEHAAVRSASGVLDASFLCVLDVSGGGALPFLRRVLSNDVQQFSFPGKVLLSCLLNEQGGVIDTLLVYQLGSGVYRLVCNPLGQEKTLTWLKRHAERYAVAIRRPDKIAILSVQGPQAFPILESMLLDFFRKKFNALRRFEFFEHDDILISRTGYTGEDGIDIMLPHHLVSDLWHDLLSEGVKPFGLTARDALRLEMGFCAKGKDVTELVTPMESRLSHAVSLEDVTRDFIGRSVIENPAHINSQLVGFRVPYMASLSPGQSIFSGEKVVGHVTSVAFSAVLNQLIGLGRLHRDQEAQSLQVVRRGRRIDLIPSSLPFVS